MHLSGGTGILSQAGLPLRARQVRPELIPADLQGTVWDLQSAWCERQPLNKPTAL